MAHQSKLDKARLVFHCSSSIDNFHEKLQKRLKLPDLKWWQFWKSVVFFGMYNAIDYLKLIWCRGEKKIFWCGGDILNLKNRKYWRIIISKIKAEHYCENQIEKDGLKDLGIESKIEPMLFDNPKRFKLSFKRSDNAQVFLCAHPGREKDYGIDRVEFISGFLPNVIFHIYGIEGESLNSNIIYHGEVSEEQFNEEIKNYHGSVRLNEFDGFSEVTAKTVLLGQYPITKIKYPYIENYLTVMDLIDSLNLIRLHAFWGFSNEIVGQNWATRLEKNLKTVLS